MASPKKKNLKKKKKARPDVMVLGGNPCKHIFSHCSFWRLFAVSFSCRKLLLGLASWEEGQTLQDGGLSGASRAAGFTLGHREEKLFLLWGLNGWLLAKSACLLVWSMRLAY